MSKKHGIGQETSVNPSSTQRHIPEDNILHILIDVFYYFPGFAQAFSPLVSRSGFTASFTFLFQFIIYLSPTLRRYAVQIRRASLNNSHKKQGFLNRV
jgi:hypothetical protein